MDTLQLQKLDAILSNESKEYKQVAEVTQYLSKIDQVHHRHLFDVMRQIKSAIPEHIFCKYVQAYLWLINDCLYRAPEVFFVSWEAFGELLVKIEDAHVNEPFVANIKKIFTGES